MSHNARRWVTTREAAEALGISVRGVVRAVEAGHLERPDLPKVTRILTSGTWFDIKAGGLQAASGVQHANVGAVEPLYRFRFPDGQEGAILARCLDGWGHWSPVTWRPGPSPCRSSTSR